MIQYLNLLQQLIVMIIHSAKICSCIYTDNTNLTDYLANLLLFNIKAILILIMSLYFCYATY